MRGTVAIVDIGTGNLRSVWRAVNRAGAAADVTNDPRRLETAAKIILPGVGNFARAMFGIRHTGLFDTLNELVLHRKTPILGICLGMELMAQASEEGRAQGLGWLSGSVKRFRPLEPKRYKVPFIGWSSVRQVRASRLFQGVDEEHEYYFLHSYYLDLRDRDCTVADADHENRFPAAIESENIFGVQFHPERSHEAGIQVLRNFLAV